MVLLVIRYSLIVSVFLPVYPAFSQTSPSLLHL